MTDQTASTAFDLQPDPRILIMLGEIQLREWACLAELIDNSIDGFVAAVRQGSPIAHPAVIIQLPTSPSQHARIEIRDNGPGMDAETLERAARAGWSSHGPTENLGLFGMGFNIATARLGQVTEVWSTRTGDSEWVGLRIDFRELVGQGHFKTPQLREAKLDPTQSGTRILISNLKPDKAEWLAQAANRTKIRKRLSRIYSAMLRSGGSPLQFELQVGNNRVLGRQHCTWDESRKVAHPRLGDIPAIITLDQDLGSRPYCTRCWQWLSDGSACPTCGGASFVINRPRRIRGWLGIQTYCDREDFGIDFLRHGRKVEIANKELFAWDQDGERELEYPIDDLRLGGRVVGEIHLDHCSVPYTKDLFSRTDPSWAEMVRFLRGDAPLRPNRASELGFAPNDTPLSRLYQAFRRATPHGRVAGAYKRLIAVKDNEAAKAHAERFHAGEAGYENDDKWWKLVEEADRELLGAAANPPAGGAAPVATIPGFAGPSAMAPAGQAPGQDAAVPLPPRFNRRLVESLSRVYLDDQSSQRFEVRAYACDARDSDLSAPNAGWRLLRRTEGHWEFLFDPAHQVFRSATLTTLDALLLEIAHQAVVFHGESRNAAAVAFSGVLAGLRKKYAQVYDLDAESMTANARDLFRQICATVAVHLQDRGSDLFEELLPSEREAYLARLANRGVQAPDARIRDGSFLQDLEPHTVVRVLVAHPELVFDGKCFDDPYEAIRYSSAEMTKAAQDRTVSKLAALLSDALWLAQEDIGAIRDASHARLIRCLSAIELLSGQMSDVAEVG